MTTTSAPAVRGKQPVILFRCITGNKPCHWIDGMHWYVEFHHCEADMAYPIGMAFVTVPPKGAKIALCVDYIWVAVHFRRQGVANAIIKACKERWPDLWLTEAISKAGQALIESASK